MFKTEINTKPLKFLVQLMAHAFLPKLLFSKADMKMLVENRNIPSGYVKKQFDVTVKSQNCNLLMNTIVKIFTKTDFHLK